MPFVKGQSGNPAGRPAGSRNKFTAEMQEALEESGLPLIQRLLELAGQGNTGAMRQCLDRLIGKHKPSSVQLPAPDSPNYVIEALTEIQEQIARQAAATALPKGIEVQLRRYLTRHPSLAWYDALAQIIGGQHGRDVVG